MSASAHRKSSRRTPILQVSGAARRRVLDWLATEEPLEVRVVPAGSHPPGTPVTVTMRTPGHDFELAAGLLFSEGLLSGREAIARISYCVSERDGKQQYNIVNIFLRPGVEWNPDFRQRSLPATSACGLCGSASLEAVRVRLERRLACSLTVTPSFIRTLPGRLEAAQAVFAQTGGLHAAALITSAGEVVAIREDIGRHNAVDKLLGYGLLQGIDLSRHILLVSGRAGFEIVQKAAVAGIPVTVAISAPSSLAVDLARSVGMTLIGFIRSGRFNVYAGAERLAASDADETLRAEEGSM